jgi:hypothetical protein
VSPIENSKGDYSMRGQTKRGWLTAVVLAALSTLLPTVSARAAIIDFDQLQARGGSPCDNFVNNSISQS